VFRRAPIALIGLADQAARPDVAPLFTCRGTPAPALGCVARTQPGPRPKFVALQEWDRRRPFERRSYARPGL